MFTIQNGGAALFRIAGKDDAEQNRFVSGSISTDDFANSYLARVGGDQFCLKSRANTVTPGALAPVNVVVSAVDDRGVALPLQTFNFQIAGPPLPPAATHVIISEGPFYVDSGYAAPADPGSGTIPL